jgi:gliding-associated putative ABC transporter substrate-binding component GldG
LLSSSLNSRIISAPALISGEENRNAPEDEQFKKSAIPAAVLLEGKFTSLYANRVPLAVVDSMEKYGTTFQTSCINKNKMIIVGDGDIVLNGASQNNPLPMGVNPFTVESQYQYQFANKVFVQNCLDYLANNSGLTEAKAKDYTLRLLDSKKTSEQRSTWQLVNIGLPILLVLLFGACYQFWRKTKYTRS